MTTEQIAGQIDIVAGKLKQKAGEAIGDQAMANDGVADQVKGNAKQIYGSVKDAVQHAAEPTVAEHKAKLVETAQHLRDHVVAGAEHLTQAVQHEIDKRKTHNP